jgi:hypothetical protein
MWPVGLVLKVMGWHLALGCSRFAPCPQNYLFSSQILDDGDYLIGNPVAEAAKGPQQRGNGCDQALPFGQQQ